MLRFWLLLIFVPLAWSASGDWHEVLDHVRESVLRQVKKSTNYTCVETVDRTTYTNARNLLEGCAYDSQTPDKKRYMHDRLRLDMAVSEGHEIFAWHGAGKFGNSSEITDVVRRGSVSSGEFVGFLENIFGHKGVLVEYAGKAEVNGSSMYLFNYSVPLKSSAYRVSSTKGQVVVPFHGSFSVREADLQLMNLKAVADSILESSDICSAETNMNYQLFKISGEEALIPSLFVVKMGNAQHIYTISSNEYSQCRAFKAESTVRFDVDDGPSRAAAVRSVREQRLAGRTLLHISLRGAIDGESSYTGDAIQGVLLHPLRIKGSGIDVPKGAVADGIITMLEEREAPAHHFLVSIEFNRLSYGGTTVLFRATPVVSKVAVGKLVQIYGMPLPPPIRERYREGVLVFTSRELHLDERFSTDWITQEPDGTQTASSTGTTR